MAVKVGVNVKLDGKDESGKAFKSSEEAAKRLEKQLASVRGGWQATITAVSTAYLALRSVVQSVSNILREPIKAALEADKVFAKLRQTLTLRGLSGSRAQLEAFIDTMERATGISDTLIANIVNQNAAFGMNATQIEKATKASAALATLMGGDLKAANMQLLNSLRGQRGALASLVPAVNRLTEAELRQGRAIDIVNQELGHLITRSVSDASTAIEKASTGWSNWTKAIAQAVLGGVDWTKAYERFSMILDRLNGSLDKNRASFGAFGNWLVTTGLNMFERFADIFELMAPRMDAVTDAVKKVHGAVIVLVVPFAELAVAAASMWAAITGDDDLEQRLEVLMTLLKKTFDDGTESLLGFRRDLSRLKTELQDPIEVDFKLRMEEIERQMAEAADTRGWWDKFYDKWRSGLQNMSKRMQADQKAAMERDKKNIEQWKGIWRSVKEFFTGPEAIPPMGPPKSLMSVAPGASVGALRVADEAAAQSGVFSTDPLTVDPQLIDKRRAIIAQIIALEKDGDSEIERHKRVTYENIAKLERDARLVGIEDVAAFNAARRKADQDYLAARTRIEREISAMTANETQKLILDQQQQWEDLQRFQEQLGISRSRSLKDMTKAEIALLEQHNEERKILHQQLELELARMTGDRLTQAELQYEAHLRRLNEIAKQIPLDKARYEHAKGQIDANLAAARGETSEYLYKKMFGPASNDQIARFDNSVKDAQRILDAAQGGLSEIINQVGAAYGPLGMFVAGLINLLRIPSEQFKEMIDSIIDDMIAMVPHIMENIPLMVERIMLGIPDIIVSIVGTLLSVPMWVRFLTRLVHAVGDLLQGIFTQAVFGKSLRDKVKRAEEELTRRQIQTEPEARFGPSKPGAGDDKFKIKDVEAAQRSAVRTEFEDRFPEIIEEESKNFIDYLIEGWKDFWNGLVTGWRELWGWLVDLFTDPLSVVRQIGKFLSDIWKDWNPFSGINAGMVDTSFVSEAFQPIIDTLRAFVNDPMGTLKTAAENLLAFIRDPMKKIRTVVDKWSGIVKDKWKVLQGITDKWGEIILDRWPWLRGIVDEFHAFRAETWGQLKPIADKFQAFVKDKWEVLQGITDKWGEIILDRWPWLRGIVNEFHAFRAETWGQLKPIADKFQAFVDDQYEDLKAIGDKFQAFVDDQYEDLKAIGDKMQAWAENAGDMVWQRFQAAGTAATSWLSNLGNIAWDGLRMAGDAAGSWVSSLGSRVWDGLQASANAAAAWVTSLGTSIWSGMRDAGDVARAWVVGLGTSIWDGLQGQVQQATAVFQSAGNNIWVGLLEGFQGYWNWLKNVGLQFWVGLLEGFQGYWNWLKNIGWQFWVGLLEGLQANWNWLKNVGWRFWAGLLDGLQTNWDWLKNVGWRFWSGLLDGLQANWNWLKNVGWRFWAGLLEGLQANWDWLKKVGGRIWDGIKSGLGSITGGGGGGGLLNISIPKFSTGGDISSGMIGDKRTIALWEAMGAIHAQEGLHRVPGAGIGDKVPILAEPGERVLSRAQVRALDAGVQGVTVNIHINVAAGAQTPDRNALREIGESVIEYIRRESRNGRNILRPQGVY